MIRQYELAERVRAYDPNVDEDGLDRAYIFAMKAHGSQKRASGDPYFSHPIEVAGILTGIRLDSATIVTALLHDTVEDTDATIEEIERLFGREVAQLVDGVTKLSRIELQSDDTMQAENFRKLLLAMSDDIRVLLVKLADRLHNMRTLKHVDNFEKRYRVARETMEIYAPLAARIGMREIQDELEDLAFMELNPEARNSVITRLEYLRSTGKNHAPKIIKELKATLSKAGIPAEISGREKKPHSIWEKMERKNISFEQLSDIIAFRIVVKDVPRCYEALGVVHSAYQMVPGRFKDFISTAKLNGYQSIHTTVIGPNNNRIEIQLRTTDMHRFAEIGVAAHWQYKAKISTAARHEGRQYRWIRELLEILDQASGPEEFLENTKLEMFADQVFNFTPKGDIKALPRGSTLVDFAYAVHSEVGNTCVGAKVNGRMKPLRTILVNGDQVEIICSKSQTPSPSWERFVVTGRARSHIRRFLRQQKRDEYLNLGRAIVQKAFRRAKQSCSEKTLDKLRLQYSHKTVDDLYAAVGDGVISGRELVAKAYPEANVEHHDIISLKRRRAKTEKAGDDAVIIRGLIPGMAMHYAGCCHPLPGDRIVGIVATGRGVTIHTIDCETLESFADELDRWLDVAWETDNDGDTVYLGRVKLVIANEPGSLGNLSTVVAKSNSNISNLKITNRSSDFFDILLDIEVRNVKHLTIIIAALRTAPMISGAERARG